MINRRTLLKNGLLSAGAGIAASYLPPVEQLLKIMSSNIISKANADENGNPINYLSFHFMGAPARWCFDQFLKVKPGDSIISNLGVATNFASSGDTYTETEFSTVDFKGMPVPLLWNSTVNSSRGGTRNLNELLPHMISFRGYGSGVDGHPSNSSRQTNPVPSAGSLTGHVADQSSKLFRAMQFPNLSNWSGYNSIRGTGLSMVIQPEDKNLAKSLLSPFLSRPSNNFIESLRYKYESLITEATKQIRFIASQRESNLETLNLDFENTQKILRQGVEDLDVIWSSLYQKYESIILGSIKDRTVKGFSDKPVLSPADITSSTMVNDNILKPTTGLDLRDWLNSVDCYNLIASFALAEFVLSRGYSGSMEFGSLEPKNLIGFFENNSDPSIFTLKFDQHNTGVFPMTFLNAMFFRGVGAGLLELIDQLKQMNLFNQTFIHLVQEFGRTPRADGSGSDHAFDGMMSTLLTGLNNDKPIVVGNILQQGGPDPVKIPGTFGQGGLTNLDGESIQLSAAHVTSTIASLMELNPNPWINVAHPLVEKSNNTLSVRASGDIV